MGKTKTAKPGKAASDDKVLSTVKDAAVQKPSQTPKAKSKELAKQVASKPEVNKKARAAAESSDDDSDAESGSDEDSDESGSDDEDASDESSGDDEDSDASSAPPNGINGHAKATEDDSDSEEDSSDEEEVAKPNGNVEKKAVTSASKDAKAESSDESDDSEDDSEADSDDDDDDSEEDSDDDEPEQKAPEPKKRKAEEVTTPAPKKNKSDAGVSDDAKRNLFVGQLSWNVDEEWLTREFEEYGEIESVTIIKDRNSGRSKGFGYVKFMEASCGERAKEERHRSEIDGRTINVDYNQPKDFSTPRSADRAQRYGDNNTSEESSTLFVANLSFDATQDVVGEEFGKHADVMGVRLPTDKETGAPKGFGYVEFSSVDEAKKAFGKMTGAKIMGRPIRLDYSSPRPPRQNGDSPGGFRGGRGGGRGGGGGGFGRGGQRGGRGGSTNRGGFGDFQGKKMTFS